MSPLNFWTIVFLGLCAVFYALDKLILQARRTSPDGTIQPMPFWLNCTAGFFPYVLIFFLFKSFLLEHFLIPSGSLLPTLQIGDRIVTDKISYGVRSPFTNNTWIEVGHPKRGDIAVFRYPSKPSLTYVKRVVGVPGDVLVYRDKQLSVNGMSFPLQKQSAEQAQELGMEQYQETIVASDGTRKPHSIWISPGEDVNLEFQPDFKKEPTCSYSTREIRCVVPEGHYYMMGDNRDKSSDSRVWGFVSDKDILGKARLVVFSSSGRTPFGQTL